MPNALIYAKALFALHEAGLLQDPACKGPVKIFIRQSSEDNNHWHLSTHYRSKKAAAKIQAENIRTAAQYQAFCRKKDNGLRHEHMVPGTVVYKLITSHDEPSVEAFHKILRITGFRATITREEDKLLLRKSVPNSFFDPNSAMYFHHLARYIHAGIAGDLEARPAEGWFQRAL